jgi:hypothetical protein
MSRIVLSRIVPDTKPGSSAACLAPGRFLCHEVHRRSVVQGWPQASARCGEAAPIPFLDYGLRFVPKMARSCLFH